MLVVFVAITLLLSRPTHAGVLAIGFGAALPWTRVALFMFAAIVSIDIRELMMQMNLRQVTVTSEDSIAHAALLVDVHGRGILLAASHGALNALVDFDRLVGKHRTETVEGALEGDGFVVGVGHTTCQRDALSILHGDKLSRLAVDGQTTVEYGGGEPVAVRIESDWERCFYLFGRGGAYMMGVEDSL